MTSEGAVSVGREARLSSKEGQEQSSSTFQLFTAADWSGEVIIQTHRQSEQISVKSLT